MYNGIINVYKEKGFTSHDVVAKMRGIYGQKKIGHTGTLDPEAEGVLPVCLGKATKVCDLLTDRDKTYEAVLRLGIVTDTQDMTGQILRESNDFPSAQEAEEVIYSFLGSYDQIPPMYSALKVNGKKLYELARAGQTVERKARRVEIKEIQILEMDLPRIRIRVTCSKGTYIRTLCQDIGDKLGCGGCMEKLLRTRVGEFRLENALTLDQIQALKEEENLGKALTKVDSLFLTYPACHFKEELKKVADNGNRMPLDSFKEKINPLESQKIRLYDCNDVFYGIYEFSRDKNDYKPLKIFKE